MAELKDNKTECCSCNCFSVINGFKFGFGVFIAFLAGIIIVILLAIALFYLLSALGINF